jgi:hypothetical protein
MERGQTALRAIFIRQPYADVTDRLLTGDCTSFSAVKRRTGVVAVISIAKKEILHLTALHSGSNNSARNQFWLIDEL